MRAVRCHRFAGEDENGNALPNPAPLSEVLSLDSVPCPNLDSHSVLIETHFAGIQYPDALQAQGLYQIRPELPYVPGSDLTGVIQAVGDQVKGFQVGDRVIAQVPTGGLAEQTLASPERIWKVPDGIALSDCANLGRNYFAAYHSLHVISDVQPNDLVLIDGASGGVGMAGIQLAKAMGASVIAGVSSEEKMPFPKEAGADFVFTYGRTKDSYRKFKSDVQTACGELGRPNGVDCILDMVQGELFESALLSCLKPLGHVCLIGFTAGQKAIRPGMILIKQAAVVGSLWSPWAQQHPQRHQQNVERILNFFSTGKIQPRAERLIEFEDYIEAFQIYERNQGRGNTVVRVRS